MFRAAKIKNFFCICVNKMLKNDVGTKNTRNPPPNTLYIMHIGTFLCKKSVSPHGNVQKFNYTPHKTGFLGQ